MIRLHISSKTISIEEAIDIMGILPPWFPKGSYASDIWFWLQKPQRNQNVGNTLAHFLRDDFPELVDGVDQMVARGAEVKLFLDIGSKELFKMKIRPCISIDPCSLKILGEHNISLDVILANQLS